MPIYEYQCSECHYEFEALQKMSDQPLVDCPQCQSASLSKKISAAAFRLSGSGWYETDFKSGNKKNLAGDAGKSDGSSSANKKGDSSSKSDSKPNTSTATSS